MGSEHHSQPRRRVTLREVHAHRDGLLAIAGQFGVSNVRVFGSVARGEADDDSDLDLLVHVASDHGLLSLAEFALAVEDLLGVLTQVSTEPGLKARIRQRVLAEAAPL